MAGDYTTLDGGYTTLGGDYTTLDGDMDRAGEDGKVRFFNILDIPEKVCFCPKSLDFYKMATCYTFLESLGPGQCSRNIFKIF